VITGEIPLDTLMNDHPGEIKAQILEEDGQIIMRKSCPRHGQFDDVMSTDPKFLERIESLFYAGAPVDRPEIRPAEIGASPEWITSAGDLRTLPCQFGEYDGIDGFYCARLVKRG